MVFFVTMEFPFGCKVVVFILNQFPPLVSSRIDQVSLVIWIKLTGNLGGEKVFPRPPLAG